MRPINYSEHQIVGFLIRPRPGLASRTSAVKKAPSKPLSTSGVSSTAVTPVKGAKMHSDLAGAYAVMAAIEKKLKSDKLSPSQQEIVMRRVRENIGALIERGDKFAINTMV